MLPDSSTVLSRLVLDLSLLFRDPQPLCVRGSPGPLIVFHDCPDIQFFQEGPSRALASSLPLEAAASSLTFHLASCFPFGLDLDATFKAFLSRFVGIRRVLTF